MEVARVRVTSGCRHWNMWSWVSWGHPQHGHLPVWCMCACCSPVLSHPFSIFVSYMLVESGRDLLARPIPIQLMSLSVLPKEQELIPEY